MPTPGPAPLTLSRLATAARLMGPAGAGAVMLRTPRLTLRPPEDSDRDQFLRVLRTSREHLLTCPLAREGESDEQAFERHLGLARAAHRTGKAWRQIAFDREGRLVGGFNLNDITRGLEHRAEATWWVSAECTGRGYATEALRAALEHAFADLPYGLGLHRVTALIDPGNMPSLRIASALGLRRLPEADTRITLGGARLLHHAFAAFAPVTEPRVQDPPHGNLRRALAQLLRTEGIGVVAIDAA